VPGEGGKDDPGAAKKIPGGLPPYFSRLWHIQSCILKKTCIICNR